MASFLYTDAIGLMIYLSVVQSRQKQDLSALMPIIHVISFTIPLILAATVAVANVEGSDPGFGTGVCWIPESEKYWRLVGGKVVEWASWIFVSCTYLPTLIHVAKLNIKKDFNLTALKLLFIPTIFIILRVPSGVRTIHDYAVGEQGILWLSILQALGDYGQGFANGIWFIIFQREVRNQLLDKCRVNQIVLDNTTDPTLSSTPFIGDLNDPNSPYHSIQAEGVG